MLKRTPGILCDRDMLRCDGGPFHGQLRVWRSTPLYRVPINRKALAIQMGLTLGTVQDFARGEYHLVVSGQDAERTYRWVWQKHDSDTPFAGYT